MKPILYLSLLPLTILLLGSTAYVPRGELGGIEHGGYDSVMINQNTAKVSFEGDSGDSPQSIRRNLLYRCAQVAMDNGYDYFVITSTSMGPTNTLIKERRVTKKIYPTASFPQTTYTEQKIKSYRAYQTEANKCDMCTASICKSHSAVAIIKMYSGVPDANLPRVYMVDDVLTHFSPYPN